MIEIALLSFALSIDAFSVSLIIGCRCFSVSTAFKVAFVFGLFQFIMPIIGDMQDLF